MGLQNLAESFVMKIKLILLVLICFMMQGCSCLIRKSNFLIPDGKYVSQATSESIVVRGNKMKFDIFETNRFPGWALNQRELGFYISRYDAKIVLAGRGERDYELVFSVIGYDWHWVDGKIFKFDRDKDLVDCFELQGAF